MNHLLKNCSNVYSENQFVKVLKNYENTTLLDNPTIKHELLPKMLEACQSIAEDRSSEIVKNGMIRMENLLQRET